MSNIKKVWKNRNKLENIKADINAAVEAIQIARSKNPSSGTRLNGDFIIELEALTTDSFLESRGISRAEFKTLLKLL